jgi:hypothetical protein
MVETHNHEILPNSTGFSSETTSFESDILERIEVYVKADLNLRTVIRLLRADWPDHSFIPQRVSNEMAKINRNRASELSEAAQLLLLLHDRQLEDSNFFIAKDVDETTGCLRRLFWMEPQQRILYLRYSDVVLNDNTSQTNRFNMPLSVFVVVDNNGKSRIVACALVCGETTSDYEWILEKLMEVQNGLAPAILLVDEDPAMEAACAHIIPQTTVLNCIWHIGSLNVVKNLQPTLRQSWDAFLPRFWSARNALTTEDFEDKWSALIQDFGGEGRESVNAYLSRLFDRRERWGMGMGRNSFHSGTAIYAAS